MPRKIKNTEDINAPVMVEKEQDITPVLEPEKAESITTSSEEEAIEKKPNIAINLNVTSSLLETQLLTSYVHLHRCKLCANRD